MIEKRKGQVGLRVAFVFHLELNEYGRPAI